MSEYYKVGGNYNVPRQVIEDLVLEADPGISYWAESMHMDRGLDVVRIQEYDGYEYLITYRDIAQALCDLAMEGYPAEYAVLTGHEEELDIDLADRVVQMAALGELRYG